MSEKSYLSSFRASLEKVIKDLLKEIQNKEKAFERFLKGEEFIENDSFPLFDGKGKEIDKTNEQQQFAAREGRKNLGREILDNIEKVGAFILVYHYIIHFRYIYFILRIISENEDFKREIKWIDELEKHLDKIFREEDPLKKLMWRILWKGKTFSFLMRLKKNRNK